MQISNDSISLNRDPQRLVSTTPDTLVYTDGVVEFDCTAAGITFNLLAASDCKGWRYLLTKVDSTANAVIIDPAAAETINGNPNATLGAQWDAILIESDGVGWLILAMYSKKTDPNSGASYAGVPTGSILPFGGAEAPTGWSLCDGSSQLRVGAFAALFAVIGTAFGTADGTHFNLPDFRGRFMRGVDGAAGRDPEDAARTAMNAGGNTGDAVGSIQGFATAAPTIPFTVATDNAAGADPASVSLGIAAAGTIAVAGGDAETRPINAYVNFIIKL